MASEQQKPTPVIEQLAGDQAFQTAYSRFNNSIIKRSRPGFFQHLFTMDPQPLPLPVLSGVPFIYQTEGDIKNIIKREGGEINDGYLHREFWSVIIPNRKYDFDVTKFKKKLKKGYFTITTPDMNGQLKGTTTAPSVTLSYEKIYDTDSKNKNKFKDQYILRLGGQKSGNLVKATYDEKGKLSEITFKRSELPVSSDSNKAFVQDTKREVVKISQGRFQYAGGDYLQVEKLSVNGISFGKDQRYFRLQVGEDMYMDGIPHLAALIPFNVNTAVIKERFNSGEFSQLHDLCHVLTVGFMSRELNAQMNLLPQAA